MSFLMHLAIDSDDARKNALKAILDYHINRFGFEIFFD